jgi:ribosome-associated toxin RatA of RatAB toxin-antitoxin module
MEDIKFELKLPANLEKLYELFTDFQNYKKIFPRQLKQIEVIHESHSEVTTKEILVFNTFFKNSEIHQTTIHQKKKNGIISTVTEGPFKKSKIDVTFIESGSGTIVKCNIKLETTLKYRILSSFIKNRYQAFLTAILYKMNTLAMNE